MSGHTSTAALAPLDGWTKYESHSPSGVLMLRSLSFTSTAFDARGSIAARPTAAASTPTSRRVYFLRSSSK